MLHNGQTVVKLFIPEREHSKGVCYVRFNSNEKFVSLA